MYMNMFASFGEIPAMILQDIKEQNVTEGRTHGRMDTPTDNVKRVYPPQTKFAGRVIICVTNNCVFSDFL